MWRYSAPLRSQPPAGGASPPGCNPASPHGELATSAPDFLVRDHGRSLPRCGRATTRGDVIRSGETKVSSAYLRLPGPPGGSDSVPVPPHGTWRAPETHLSASVVSGVAEWRQPINDSRSERVGTERRVRFLQLGRQIFGVFLFIIIICVVLFIAVRTLFYVLNRR